MTEARADLPPAVRDLALRCGARSDQAVSAVTMSQSGFMKSDPEDRPMSFSAKETIQLDRTEFLWEAKCDPISLLVVRDRLIGAQGQLSLSAFGVLPLSTVSRGAHVTRGETMRYLAELPWAPDAILQNADLAWSVLDPRTFQVSAGAGDAKGSVTLKLDEQGFVRVVEAAARPRKEGSGFVDRPWRGRFAAYEARGGRTVPQRGEMTWIIDGIPIDCWVGELGDWRLH